MGVKAEEKLEVTREELPTYLRANHSVYMEVEGVVYYLTDVNDQYWRVQSTTELNEKGHYTDISELVPVLSEFLKLEFDGGKTIDSCFDKATFYASVK